MIQNLIVRNIVDILTVVVICGWLPLQDPNLSKLLALPVLLYFGLREIEPRYSRTASLCLLFFWGLLEAVHPYNREILIIWLFSVISAWLGFRNSDKKLDFIAIMCGLTALTAAFIEISGFADSLSSKLFGSNTALCAMLCLLCQPLRERTWNIRLSYALMCIPAVYLSASIIGIVIFSFGIAYLLAPQKHLKLRRLIILIPVVTICALIAQPKETYLQALEKQVSTWQSNFQSWSLVGKGPATTQIINTEKMSAESLMQSQPRLELHPQNDLLFHYHSLGISGLAIRIIMYILVLNLVLNSTRYFPLLLFIIQTQFTSDFLTLPAGVLFFFILGQALGSSQNIKLKNRSSYYWPLLHSIWCSTLIFQLIFNSRYHLNIRQSTSVFKSSQRLKFSNPALQISHINHLYKIKKFDECLESIQKHLEIDPFHLYSHLLGADILIQQSKFQEALEWIKNSRTQLPSSEALKQKENLVSAQLSNN